MQGKLALHGQSFKDCHAIMLANHGTCKQLRPRLLVVCRALKSSFARATAGRFIHPACVHTHTQVLLGTQHTRALAGDDCMQTQSRVHGPLRASLSTTLLINNSSTSTLTVHAHRDGCQRASTHLVVLSRRETAVCCSVPLARRLWQPPQSWPGRSNDFQVDPTMNASGRIQLSSESRACMFFEILP
jgi:hypothetical protein